MNRNTDTLRVATFLGERFAIYTTDPKRLGKFARDILASGIVLTVAQLSLRESLERVAKW